MTTDGKNINPLAEVFGSPIVNETANANAIATKGFVHLTTKFLIVQKTKQMTRWVYVAFFITIML